MKKVSAVTAVGMLAFFLGLSPAWSASVGKKAPAFKAKDTYGKVRQLSDFKGKFVVLEWHNPHCPFVQSY